MVTLEKPLRNKLERTVKEAREISEEAAREALEQLGVGESVPFAHLTEELRDLRRRLRIHSRQLGDFLHPKSGKQEIERLVEEVAYEHWHRMLFARFLAENNLLMYPDANQPVPVTLQECEDLAADEGARNGWELAARFAARMLPQIFRPDSPVFEPAVSPEHQLKLERLLADLPAEVFTASDSLGWVYQFWQAKKKDEVDASEVKIGARELPVVTQLFTEPYMVAFLLDNSLGAWWAATRLTEDDLQTAQTEEELRQKASLPGVSLEYLRFVKDAHGNWTPAAGTFDTWPESLAQLKVLDPCCGSGHFLVAALLMLVPMRMELEALPAHGAVEAVLRENLHGLEIDSRCVQLAAFALALTAWRFPDSGGYRKLPPLNLACSGLAVSVSKEEWKRLAIRDHNMRIALDWLYDEFKDAPLLGSLLSPAKGNAAQIVEWEKVLYALEAVSGNTSDNEQHEMAVVAHGLAEAARLLGDHYDLVITNVPYLTRGKHSDPLKKYLDIHYRDSKNDLATVFLNRCLEFCLHGGTISVVMPQNWLFLTSYRKFRERLLGSETWKLIGRLGFAAFDIMDWWAFNTTLISMGRGQVGAADNALGVRSSTAAQLISGIDASPPRDCAEKAELLKTVEIGQVEQEKQINNPDARVILDPTEEASMFANYASGLQGIATSDYPRFGRNFWELPLIDNRTWIFQQSTIEETIEYGGRQHVLLWEAGSGELCSSPSARVQGLDGWGKTGIAVGQMRHLPATLFTGEAFDNNTAAIVVEDESHLPAVWCFCSSPEYNEAVRRIDQKLNVTNATLVKVPFDLEHWQEIADKRYPNGLPKPYSSDPTQWIFHGHPAKSDHPLQVAVARLLEYRWPAQVDAEMELSEEARMWVAKCEDLVPYGDNDGIICIPPVRGEAAASDRVQNLLAAAYGDQWGTTMLSTLLAEVDHTGKTLESWLRDKFFIQHCKLLHNRPFIWQIWDGLPDGFSVLANYHRLDKKNLETAIYTYLGDWIRRQEDDINSGVDGAEERLTAAENLKKKLEFIREGEAPYDIFVRWKSIEEQPIGWEPDLNDGVRLNIRPFMSVPDVGKKGAGVLRDKPNIKWNKDRGKDVESAPWYHLFRGDRVNDRHLTLAEKRAARAGKK